MSKQPNPSNAPLSPISKAGFTLGERHSDSEDEMPLQQSVTKTVSNLNKKNRKSVEFNFRNNFF